MEIRLLHIEDRDLIRAGIRSIFADSVIHLIGSAYTESEARRLTIERNPDIVLFNIQMKSFNGVEFLRQYRHDFPEQKVIILTATNEFFHLIQSAILGVTDYILDNIPAEVLLQRLQSIYYGTGMSPNEDWRKIHENPSPSRFRDLRMRLTQREEQVLRYLVQGMSNKEIAAELRISAETVKEHVQHILRKLGVHDRTEAAVWAVRKGFV
ncbi:MAG: response regulator transcription factor [Planctomycetia bacterium]|nr:response regulator transcription factor [Planctomycetia bacterium]